MIRILYDNDQDGWACARIVHKNLHNLFLSLGKNIDFSSFLSLSSNVEFVCLPERGNGKLVCDLVKDVDAVLMDYSLSDEKDVLKMIKDCKSLLWIDHHKTTVETLERLKLQGLLTERLKSKIRLFYNENKSACQIAYQFFSSTPIPNWIRYIDCYDTGNFPSSDAEYMTYPLIIFMKAHAEECANPETPIWRRIESYPFESYPFDESVVLEGRAMIKLEVSKIRDALKSSTISYVGELTILLVNYKPAITFLLTHSDIVHNLSDEFKLDAVCSFLLKRKSVTANLYSLGSKPVLPIAKMFNGGGHDKACGFQTTVQKFFEVFKPNSTINHILSQSLQRRFGKCPAKQK